MLLAVALALDLAAIADAVPPCAETMEHCYAIQLHVGSAVAADVVARQVALANEHFAAIDVGFELAGVVAHDAAEAITRGDRDRLSQRRSGPPRIDVFVVGRLGDIDAPGSFINGVAWKVPRRAGHKVIILSATAWERTLTHELGHVFGLPHSTYAVSLMNKTPRDEPPIEQRTFAAEELAIMRAQRARLARTRVIAPVVRIRRAKRAKPSSEP